MLIGDVRWHRICIKFLIRSPEARSTMKKGNYYICQEAASILAAMIRKNRKQKRMTQHQLADRAGVSRATVQKIEKGDMGTSMGQVFEVAVIAGVRLFDMEERELAKQERHYVEKLALMPRRVRVRTYVLDDDF